MGTIQMVTSFYSKVLTSPLLYHHFVGVPMEVLVAKQVAFIDTIVRGNPGYSSADLQRIHAHLKIDDNDFDELMRLLDASLRKHVTDPGVRSVIHGGFASFRQAIISDDPK